MRNVVAVGSTSNTGTGDDSTIIKFDGATGDEQWRRVVNGSANGPDQALAVTVDGMGNVVAVGSTRNTDTGDDFTVIKFDGATGDELWRTLVVGTLPNGADAAFAVAVDGEENVVAAGRTVNTGTGSDFTVGKFDGATGALLWGLVLNGSANGPDQALAVTLDGEGNVVAAGSIRSFLTGDDFTVAKFDGATGDVLWGRNLNGSASSIDQARAVTVDGMGNVVAAGSIRSTGTFDDFTVIKFDGATGDELWRTNINGSANVRDEARAVMVDGMGNVVAAGSTRNTDTGFSDFTAVKLDGATGDELWRTNINGSANTLDEAVAVAVDGAGDVVAAGFTQNTGTGTDFTVVKLRGTDGGDF
jgi:outer membrane protein assembly factor BamB